MFAHPLILDNLVISALRVYGIQPRDWTMPTIILALSLVPVATNLVRHTRSSFPASPLVPPRYHCPVVHKLRFLASQCAHGLEACTPGVHLLHYKRHAFTGAEYVSAPVVRPSQSCGMN